MFGLPGESLQVKEIDDLHGWLTGLYPPPFSAVINPGLPRGMSAVIAAGSLAVIGVNGQFDISPSSSLVRTQPPKWQGYATFHYPGGPDRDLLPLERSFARHPLGEHARTLGELSDDEIEEILSQLTADPLPVIDPWTVESDVLFEDDPLLVEAWDTAFGEGFIQLHANLIDLVAWLKGYEREADRTARSSGFKFSFWDVGVQGSGNPMVEDLRGSETARALDQWLQSVVRRGYRPSDTDHLTKIVNALFATLQISVVGFLSDITWRLQAQESGLEDFFHEGSGIDFDAAIRWLAERAEPQLDPIASQDAASRISPDVWNHLQQHSQVFITTGLADFESRGLSPLLDYAPINLSLVKALETELNAVLDTFPATIRDAVSPPGDLGENERVLMALITEGRHPTIGQTRHLLSKAEGPLQVQFHDHLRSIGASNLLTSKYREGLYKTVSRYRNGGVHDQTVSLGDCRRCIQHLVDGDEKRLGLISQTVTWKVN